MTAQQEIPSKFRVHNSRVIRALACLILERQNSLSQFRAWILFVFCFTTAIDSNCLRSSVECIVEVCDFIIMRYDGLVQPLNVVVAINS